MYSVLIVDDEKMIRDDVYELLAMENDLELDLSTAASAVEACSIMEQRKIDIAVMDINMPQMSGLELYDIVRERWPHCKVIFLTGYSDFDYIYKVHKHARYVLKAEEDEKILMALRESIEEMENDLLLEKLDGLQREQEKVPLVHERSLFLMGLFGGDRGLGQLTEELAAELDIPLNPQKDLYYVLLRHEAWQWRNYREQQDFKQDFYKLIDRYFLDFMQGTFFEYSIHYVVILLQPKNLLKEESVIRMLAGAGELFQKALKKNLAKTTSILIGARAVPFETVIQEFKLICDQAVWLNEEELSFRELNMDEGDSANWDFGDGESPGEREQSMKEKAFMGEGRFAGAGQSAKPGQPGRKAAAGSLSEGRKQELLQKVWKLEYWLEGMEEENTLALLRELQRDMQGIRSMHDLFALEVYCTISSRLIGWIKRLGLQEEIALRVGTMNLYNVSFHENWQDAFGYLRNVAENIFSLKKENAEKQTEDVVNQVKKYIVENLGGDTSLYHLADQVHFSQEYLLRIFKKKEGVTILQYINDLKLSAAKQLLAEAKLPVKEIAEQLGFNSQGYFGRFFRNKTGMAPNAYREGQGR
jgi:two-component system response regulator YesN|nr:helix-turn-helix domain-containing protein [uncultured Acetatifactor sp.]